MVAAASDSRNPVEEVQSSEHLEATLIENVITDSNAGNDHADLPEVTEVEAEIIHLGVLNLSGQCQIHSLCLNM